MAYNDMMIENTREIEMIFLNFLKRIKEHVLIALLFSSTSPSSFLLLVVHHLLPLLLFSCSFLFFCLMFGLLLFPPSLPLSSHTKPHFTTSLVTSGEGSPCSVFTSQLVFHATINRINAKDADMEKALLSRVTLLPECR